MSKPAQWADEPGRVDPAWRVCVHWVGGRTTALHPSLAEWLRICGEGRAACVADAGSERIAAAAWAQATGAHEPDVIVVSAAVDALDALKAAMPWAGGRDLAYIQADCAVSGEWDSLLARASCTDPVIASVSPLSAATPVLSPFTAGKPDWMEVEHVARWLPHLSHGQVFEIPEAATFCSYWRAAALTELAAAGGSPAWSDGEAMLRRRGWCFVACDWVYVDAPAPMNAEPARTHEAMESFMTYHPLLRMRHGFGEAGSWGEASVPPPAPIIKAVQLHVAHSWGGGLGRWVEDYCEGDGRRWNLVLRSIGTWGAFGQRIALYRSHQMDRPLRDWLLDKPIGSIAIRHIQYRRILDEIVRDFDIDAILVSSLIGHSLDVLDTNLPTTVIAHDYTPFCAALSIRFDGVCTECGPDRLRACFAGNELNRFFRDAGAAYWEALRTHWARYLHRSNVQMVAPSASVARNLKGLLPALADVPITLIAHGMAFAQGPEWSPPAEGRLRLLVLGSLAPQKGAELLAEVLTDLAGFADVFLVGCGDEGQRFERLGDGRVVRSYRREELSSIVAGIAPHAGLLLSVVPETFSYTLSELWAMGVPPVATRLGGFADRIDDGETGFLVDPEPSALLARLRDLDRARGDLERIRLAIRGRAVRSREQMVAEYHGIEPLGERSPLAGVEAGVPGRPLALRAGDREATRIGALHVDRQVPLRLVLKDFSLYLGQKVDTSPRLGAWRKRTLRAALRAGTRLLGKDPAR